MRTLAPGVASHRDFEVLRTRSALRLVVTGFATRVPRLHSRNKTPFWCDLEHINDVFGKAVHEGRSYTPVAQ